MKIDFILNTYLNLLVYFNFRTAQILLEEMLVRINNYEIVKIYFISTSSTTTMLHTLLLFYISIYFLFLFIEKYFFQVHGVSGFTNNYIYI